MYLNRGIKLNKIELQSAWQLHVYLVSKEYVIIYIATIMLVRSKNRMVKVCKQ